MIARNTQIAIFQQSNWPVALNAQRQDGPIA
jgi:hypothetical protein